MTGYCAIKTYFYPGNPVLGKTAENLCNETYVSDPPIVFDVSIGLHIHGATRILRTVGGGVAMIDRFFCTVYYRSMSWPCR